VRPLSQPLTLAVMMWVLDSRHHSPSVNAA
jgi:hypothetical protein